MDMLLKILSEDWRCSNRQLSVLLGISEDEVEKKIKQYEDAGIIRGYKTVINCEKVDDHDTVTALIEIRVSPNMESGFDGIAREIVRFDEVESVYLMSGGFDLSVVVNGHTFKDIATFVSQKLAPLPSVLSTATHFVLTRYKDDSIIMSEEPAEERRYDLYND